MKNYIKVTFAEKDQVKALNGRWDNDMKAWYIPDGEDESKFSKWEKFDPNIKADRIYINVPFAEKDDARKAFARWDGDKKQWYYLSDMDPKPFARWLDGSAQPTQVPTKTESKPTQQTSSYTPNKPVSNSGDNLSSDLDAILGLGDE